MFDLEKGYFKLEDEVIWSYNESRSSGKATYTR